MQRPQGGGIPQGVDGYEQMVNTFAEQAKTFWRSWGPPGEPIVQGTEAWVQMQHSGQRTVQLYTAGRLNMRYLNHRGLDI